MINLLKHTLFDLVKQPLASLKNNNGLISFSDNSSAIKGYSQDILYPVNDKYVHSTQTNNFVCTAETHNFPTAISPFPGAATGIGGRIRDVQTTGRGAVPVCSSAGYCR